MNSDSSRLLLMALGYVPDEDEAVPAETETVEDQPDPLADHRIHAAKVNGLPVELADRLRGESTEAVTLDAQRLAKALEAPTINRGELEAMGRDRQRQQADVDALMPPSPDPTAWSTD